MKPTLFFLSLLLASPALAQSDAPRRDAALARTADVFRDDLSDLTRLATAAALIRDRTGAFPDTPFALLGSPEGELTGARAFPLSTLAVTAAGDSLVMRYVPLPVSPYVREDLTVTATVRPEPGPAGGAGRYAVRHEMRRSADPDDGGRPLLYDHAGSFRIGKGYGRLCVDTAQARALLASGTYRPTDALVATSGDLTVRVHPTGEETPVYYEAQIRDGQ